MWQNAPSPASGSVTKHAKIITSRRVCMNQLRPKIVAMTTRVTRSSADATGDGLWTVAAIAVSNDWLVRQPRLAVAVTPLVTLIMLKIHCRCRLFRTLQENTA